jgi:hypothetical protein
MGTFTVDVTRPVDKLRARLHESGDTDRAAGFFALPTVEGAGGSAGMNFLAPTPMHQQRQIVQPEEELERLLNNQVYSREACATALVVAAGFNPTDLGTGVDTAMDRSCVLRMSSCRFARVDLAVFCSIA